MMQLIGFQAKPRTKGDVLIEWATDQYTSRRNQSPVASDVARQPSRGSGIPFSFNANGRLRK